MVARRQRLDLKKLVLYDPIALGGTLRVGLSAVSLRAAAARAKDAAPIPAAKIDDKNPLALASTYFYTALNTVKNIMDSYMEKK